MTARLLVLALLLAVACAAPTEPAVHFARFCGVRFVRVPLVDSAGTRYVEILIVPRPCAVGDTSVTLLRGSLL